MPPDTRPLPRLTSRPDVQGLRALAVVLVILDHAGVPWFRGAFVGVDVFFVISGFLISSMLLHEATTTCRVRIGHFYARRARRILPAAGPVAAGLSLGATPTGASGDRAGGVRLARVARVVDRAHPCLFHLRQLTLGARHVFTVGGLAAIAVAAVRYDAST